MSVIAAVVLGGASITGGKGSVLGSFLGVLLFAIVNNSLTLLQISSYWYNVFTGVIIILSIILNAVQDNQQKKRIIRVKVSEEVGGPIYEK
jgi:simple sugar transport system permease protein